MSAIYKELFIDQGADFNQVLRLRATRSLEPLNLAGFTPRGVFRRNPTSGVSRQFSIQVTDGESGELDVSLSAEQTTDLVGRYFYVIELVNGSEVRRAFEGVIHASPNVIPEN